MTQFEEAVDQWPASTVKALPTRVEKGRKFVSVHETDLEAFVGELFRSTEAQAIRMRFQEQLTGFWDIEVEAVSCPPVPYATLSGEHLSAFLKFKCSSATTIWAHRDCWFWAANLEDEELEKLTDLFIHSL